MGKIVQAIVRGPESYFDGEMHEPGAIVSVDEDFVSEEDEVEKEIMVKLKDPVVVDGKLTREFPETVKVRTRFRPLTAGAITDLGAGPTPVGGATDFDRLNVSDFLKGGTDDIVDAITTGKVDVHLGAIEQGEIARKGSTRKAVTDALAMRQAALSR